MTIRAILCKLLTHKLPGVVLKLMNPNQLVVKCYAKQEDGVWVAMCLDFCLATQADSFDEAKRKLEEQISLYVREAMQDKDYGSQLLKRRAPLSSWIEYYLIKVENFFCHKGGIRFDETMPLRPA